VLQNIEDNQELYDICTSCFEGLILSNMDLYIIEFFYHGSENTIVVTKLPEGKFTLAEVEYVKKITHEMGVIPDDKEVLTITTIVPI
jgi:hypothetical protein